MLMIGRPLGIAVMMMMRGLLLTMVVMVRGLLSAMFMMTTRIGIAATEKRAGKRIGEVRVMMSVFDLI
jgi:hypothetical protein